MTAPGLGGEALINRRLAPCCLCACLCPRLGASLPFPATPWGKAKAGNEEKPS